MYLLDKADLLVPLAVVTAKLSLVVGLVYPLLALLLLPFLVTLVYSWTVKGEDELLEFSCNLAISAQLGELLLVGWFAFLGAVCWAIGWAIGWATGCLLACDSIFLVASSRLAT